MNNISNNLHSKVHNWINKVGFNLNNTKTDKKSNVTTRHYFFETFNFFERAKNDDPSKTQFLCFDTYGEKVKVKSLLDLQTEFFENISQLK
jgi:hypothetical protein